MVDLISLFGPYGRDFAIFNVADSRSTVGVVLAVLLELTGRRRDGSRAAGRDAAATDEGRPPDRRRMATPIAAGARTGWTACGSTRRCPGCSGCPGPPRPTLVDAGDVAGRRAAPRPSRTRSRAGAWLEVTLPAPPPAPAASCRAGRRPARSCTADDDIVVVDKPVGVAAHPSPGWTGPTVIGGLAAMGYRIATCGAAERQGVVHRLDVGTTGLMVVAKSERAYTRAQARVQGARGRQALPRAWCRATWTRCAAPSTRRSTGTRPPTASARWSPAARPSVTHYDTLEAFPAASLLEVHLETGRTHQIRVHFAALRHPCVGDLTYGADPTLAARLGLTGSGCTPGRLAFAHPGDGRVGRVHQRRTRTTWRTRSTCSATRAEKLLPSSTRGRCDVDRTSRWSPTRTDSTRDGQHIPGVEILSVGSCRRMRVAGVARCGLSP